MRNQNQGRKYNRARQLLQGTERDRQYVNDTVTVEHKGEGPRTV